MTSQGMHFSKVYTQQWPDDVASFKHSTAQKSEWSLGPGRFGREFFSDHFQHHGYSRFFKVGSRSWDGCLVSSDSVLSPALRVSLTQAANPAVWVGLEALRAQKDFINTSFFLGIICIICLKQIINNLQSSSFELCSTSIWKLYFCTIVKVRCLT